MSILSSTNSGSYTNLTHEYIINKCGDLFVFGAEGHYAYKKKSTEVPDNSLLEQSSCETYLFSWDSFMPYIGIKTISDFDLVLAYWNATSKEEQKLSLNKIICLCLPVDQFGIPLDEKFKVGLISYHQYIKKNNLTQYIKENNIVCQS